MTSPTQASFLDALTAAVIEEVAEPPSGSPREFSGENCEPGSLDDVPLWLRLPGEEGYQEWDRHGRVVKG